MIFSSYDPNKPIVEEASAPSQEEIESAAPVVASAVAAVVEDRAEEQVVDIDDLEAPEEPELPKSTGCCGGCGIDNPTVDQILEKLMAESDSDSGPEIEEMGDVEVRDEWEPMEQFEKFQALQKGIPMEEANLTEDLLNDFRERMEDRRPESVSSSSSDSSVDTQSSQVSDSILR